MIMKSEEGKNTMRVMKRLMAVLLAAAMLAVSAPAVGTEAAGKAITAKFIDWGRRTIKVNAEDYVTYDASMCYIGVKKCNATKFYFEVYDSNGNKQLRKGESKVYKDSRYPDYQILVVPGTRRTVVCSVRVKARIDGKWSAFSGWVSLVPPHTPDYIRHASTIRNDSVMLAWSKFAGMTDYMVYMSTDARNWTLVKRTAGDRCTVETLNGSRLKPFYVYYYKGVGRKYFKGKYILEKGNSDANCKSFVIAEID